MKEQQIQVVAKQGSRVSQGQLAAMPLPVLHHNSWFVANAANQPKYNPCTSIDAINDLRQGTIRQ
ncbi:hypothetical protein [Novipirellula rosea]|uniref:hypothetical protein n=1 Tax=Novipirellula rosea TaxID=1031540 RepID=UPI0031E6F300